MRALPLVLLLAGCASEPPLGDEGCYEPTTRAEFDDLSKRMGYHPEGFVFAGKRFTCVSDDKVREAGN